jgi:hypothetical protein
MRGLRHRFVRFRLGALVWRVAPICLAAGLAGCATTSPIEDFVTSGSEARSPRAAAAGNPLLAMLRGARHQTGDRADPYSPLNGTRAPYRIATSWPWTPAEEDAIIALAITAHEMRRP